MFVREAALARVAVFAAQEQVGCIFRPVGTEDGVPAAGHEYGRLSNGPCRLCLIVIQGDGIRFGKLPYVETAMIVFPVPAELSSTIGNGGEIVPVEIVQVSVVYIGSAAVRHAQVE